MKKESNQSKEKIMKKAQNNKHSLNFLPKIQVKKPLEIRGKSSSLGKKLTSIESMKKKNMWNLKLYKEVDQIPLDKSKEKQQKFSVYHTLFSISLNWEIIPS